MPRFQYQGLQTEAFILLLHKLGFQLPADVGKVFPRIPHFWSADHVYSVAAKLGPIDTTKLPFSLEELERMAEEKTSSAELTPVLSRSPLPAKLELAGPPSPDFDAMEEMYLLEVRQLPSNHSPFLIQLFNRQQTLFFLINPLY